MISRWRIVSNQSIDRRMHLLRMTWIEIVCVFLTWNLHFLPSLSNLNSQMIILTFNDLSFPNISYMTTCNIKPSFVFSINCDNTQSLSSTHTHAHSPSWHAHTCINQLLLLQSQNKRKEKKTFAKGTKIISKRHNSQSLKRIFVLLRHIRLV